MVSCDTNVLFAAVNPDDANHAIALEFITRHADDSDFVLAEQVLIELYGLLRNPVVNKRPLGAAEAVEVISCFRRNPFWAIVDVPAGSSVMNAVWRRASERDFARRRIHDMRLAETLKHWGVVEFHTRNTKNFEDAGFEILKNPFDV